MKENEKKESLVYIGNRIDKNIKDVIVRHARKKRILIKGILEESLGMYIKKHKLK